jgi:magnesium and cobalt exporter, CNNM family
MVLLISYLLLVLVLSFICSIMEAVLLSTPIGFLKVKEESGNKNAKNFIALKKNIDKPLSAILSLNTIAHTVGAAGVGAQAIAVYGEASFGIASAILTILILVITEIIPKTVGALYWRELAMLSGNIIRVIIIVTYPLVVVSALITNLISRKKKASTTSREEFSALANIGLEEGVFKEEETKIIQNLIKLKRIKVSEIMTPRVVLTIADEELSIKEFSQNKEFLHFSRVPVYTKEKENITGYVYRHSIFEKLSEKENELKLKDIKREIAVVNDTNEVFAVWEMLLHKKEHIALVVDEYGGVDGVISMEDVFETLLGIEIVDETDRIVDMQEYARERWKQKQIKYHILESIRLKEEKKE